MKRIIKRTGEKYEEAEISRIVKSWAFNEGRKEIIACRGDDLNRKNNHRNKLSTLCLTIFPTQYLGPLNHNRWHQEIPCTIVCRYIINASLFIYISPTDLQQTTVIFIFTNNSNFPPTLISKCLDCICQQYITVTDILDLLQNHTCSKQRGTILACHKILFVD